MSCDQQASFSLTPDANIDRESWQHGTRLLHAREKFPLSREARTSPNASLIIGLTQGTHPWARPPKGPRGPWTRDPYGVYRSCSSAHRYRRGLLGVRVWHPRYARTTSLPSFHRVRGPHFVYDLRL